MTEPPIPADPVSRPEQAKPFAVPVAVVAGGVFALLLLGGLLWLAHRPPAPPPPPPSEESAAYLSNISISDVRMSVADN
ncbi:MAG TPA: hypothetical protein VNN17_01600, partial [Terriglobia bacterium]|nr:hypothetical protein [Terriglobia bacterium]